MNQRCVKSQKYLTILPCQSCTYIFYTVESVTVSSPAQERHNQSASFVTCKLAVVGTLAEDEVLWHYTAARYGLTSLHWPNTVFLHTIQKKDSFPHHRLELVC